MKKILMVNGSYNEIPLIEAAHKLGFYVITSGNDRKGEGHKYGDEYCPCDYSDKEKMLALAKEKQVDAVCSCGNDFGATTAAYISEKMGFPGHDSYDSSRAFHEKDEFKKMVEELRLNSPKSRAFTDQKEAIEYVLQTTFPKIIKPTDLGGGKGISVVSTRDVAVKSVEHAFAKSKIKHIVIEDYISGTQHGFICYVRDKKVVFDYSSNDYSYLNPFMVWVGTGYPADHYDDIRDLIISDVERMAEYKNMQDGFLTIQYIMKEGKPYYLETMRRSLGNFHFLCVSKDCGVNLNELFVATEAGLDCSHYITGFKQTGLLSGFMGLYADHNGTFKGISIDKEFEHKIFFKKLLVNSGYIVEDYLNDKLGMLCFSFDNELERKEFIKNRKNLVKVFVE